jgi:hypothetical protein
VNGEQSQASRRVAGALQQQMSTTGSIPSPRLGVLRQALLWGSPGVSFKYIYASAFSW